MKIYIVGSIASGKTTFARRISKASGISYYCLDEVVYEEDKAKPWGNRKRPVERRDEMFLSILQQSSWIIEDVGRPCFEEGLKQADKIIHLEPPTRVRNWRIIIRWIKQNLHFEHCIYRPSISMLKCMLEWSKDYDLGKDKLKARLAAYNEKVIILKNNKETNNYLHNVIPDVFI